PVADHDFDTVAGRTGGELAIELHVAALRGEAGRAVELCLRPALVRLARVQMMRLVRRDDNRHLAQRFDRTELRVVESAGRIDDDARWRADHRGREWNAHAARRLERWNFDAPDVGCDRGHVGP